MRPLQGRIKPNHKFYKHLIPSGFDYYKINTMENTTGKQKTTDLEEVKCLQKKMSYGPDLEEVTCLQNRMFIDGATRNGSNKTKSLIS